MLDFDWFLYANDDTYVVMDNLRYFLADKCADEKLMYGKVMSYYGEQIKIYASGDNRRGFIQGGCGWLVSRESIRAFVQEMDKDPENFCVMRNGAIEDQEVSDCYRKVNVYPGDSRDAENRERFLMNKFDE